MVTKESVLKMINENIDKIERPHHCTYACGLVDMAVKVGILDLMEAFALKEKAKKKVSGR